MGKEELICECNVIHKDVVKDTMDKMLDEEMFKSIAGFFKLVGDPTRSKILYALDQNEMCVCDIATLLGMTKSSISHQLATLRENGIVKARREGKEVYYSLDDEHVKGLFELGIEHIVHKQNGGN